MRKQLAKETLRAIKEFKKENNYSPSTRELMIALDLHSTSVCSYRINNLVLAGYLTKRFGIPRSLALTQKGKNLARRR